MHAERDTGAYPKGMTVSDAEMATIDLHPHRFHGEWNYTILPRLTLLRGSDP